MRRRAILVRRMVLLQAGALVLAACSVSTPRDAVLAQGTEATQQGSLGAVPDEAAQLGAEQQPAADGGFATSAGAGTGAASGAVDTVTGGTSESGAASGTSAASSNAGPATGGPSGTAPAAGAPDAAPAGSSGPVPGVTAKEIRFSVLYGRSGMYGQILDSVVDDGMGTWVEDINANGGINGRRVRMVKVDNRDTVEGGIAGCKEVQGNNSYFAFQLVGFGGADVSATDCLDRAGIPTFSYLVSAYNDRWRNVYTISEPGVTTRPLASFIKNVLKRGSTKIGLFVERDPLFTAGKQPFLEGMKAGGLKVVHTETVAPGQSSFVSEVSRMKNSGAETVVLIVSGPSGIGIPRDAASIGYQPVYTGNLFAHDEFSRGGAAIQRDIHALRYYASTNSPAFAKFVATANKYGRGNNPTALTMSLYGLGLVVEQALRNAGPAPTRSNFGAAVESIVNYENGIVGVSFGKGKRRAEGVQYPIKCCNGDNTWMGTGPPKKDF
jgi:branched-chain amino acid transport system substrate-binding protein